MDTIWHLTVDGTPAAPGPEGFVHASFTHQLAGTLDVHFAGVDRIVLLRLDPTALGDDLVCEASRGGEEFPHVYRALRDSDVLERHEVKRGSDGHFDLSGTRA